MNSPSINDLINVINSCFKKTIITEDDADRDLLELGLDSIDFIALIVKLEESYDFEFPDEKLTMLGALSVRNILKIIDEQ